MSICRILILIVVGLAAISSAHDCPYSQGALSQVISEKAGCPYGYPKSVFSNGVCPHGFNKTGSGELCPFGFQQCMAEGTSCPFGYTMASAQRPGCPYNFKKTDPGCPLGLKRKIVNGTKCPFGYKRQDALDGKCSLGFSGPLSGRGCPLGLRKRSNLWKSENSKFSEGTLCPYGFTREAATTPGCPYGYKKNNGGCPLGIKRGSVEGSKCPFGYTHREATDGKCPLGFGTADLKGHGCPFGIKKRSIAESKCPYGFTRSEALVRDCPHQFKKSPVGHGCPFGIRKSSSQSEIPKYLSTEKPREYRLNKDALDLIKSTWKIAKKNGHLAPKAFLLYFKLKIHPSAQKLFPAFADVDVANLSTNYQFLNQVYTCLSGLNAYIETLGKNPANCPYLNSPYFKAMRPDDVKLFNKVLFDVMENVLGNSFSSEARKAWKDGIIACDSAVRKVRI